MYMEESVIRQMQLHNSKASKEAQRTGLLEALINANESEKQQLQKPSSRPSYLTDSELYGNLFVFNLAGYETTAGTMTFALPYLAAHLDIQGWVREEVDAHFTSSSVSSYEETYPKLVRCMALMHEVLRLAGPAPQMIRSPSVPTVLPISTSSGTTSITVQPDTLISAHFYSLHLSPRYWGSDPHTFDPKRFITHSPDSKKEVFAVPPDRMFIGWVFGPRVCPGKKFSQVEFVAIIAFILRRFRLEIVREDNESDKEARRRAISVLDEKYFNISTHLRRPQALKIRFVRHGEKGGASR